MPVSSIAPVVPAPTAIAAAPAPSAAPLQERTAAQLQSGLHVTTWEGTPVDGAPKGTPAPTKAGTTWNELAVGRLMQDAADFVGHEAGVKPSLGNVYINDKVADSMGAAGYAFFSDGGTGNFDLSPTTTRDIVDGVKRLHDTPFTKWSATDQGNFVEAQETVLHELGHVTLPSYDAKTLKSWDHNWRLNHTSEEGLTELSAQDSLPRFLKAEYGIDVPAQTLSIGRDTAAYTRWTQRLTTLADMAGMGAPEQVGALARKVGDATYPGSRAGEFAKTIAANVGGADAPKEFVKDLRDTVPYFVDEITGSRSKVRLVLQALADSKAGNPVDLAQYRKDRAEFDKDIHTDWRAKAHNAWTVPQANAPSHQE